jgi:hypothetical protein
MAPQSHNDGKNDDGAEIHRDSSSYQGHPEKSDEDHDAWHSSSHAETMIYIGQMTGELARLAFRARCPRLTYFLMMAQLESESYF